MIATAVEPTTRLASDLMLARLLPSTKKAPAPSKVRDDMARFFRERPSDERWQEMIDRLVEAGLLLTRPFRLTAAAEPLDIDALLGRGAHGRPGKTRLSIVNTQFLGDPAAVEFWVAQLLLALDRWRSKNPSQQLQAVFLFDEADAYLPAVRQPATKAPMDSLLRRARSAGVGLFLATQNPGDLDYKCRDQIRTWLIGRVKEQVAIGKLKPMLEAGRVDAAAKLPSQGTGQFYLVREREVVALQSELSLAPTAQLPEERILELAWIAGLAAC